MNNIHAIILGLVQGATEFIPVSSSGHLVLVPWLFGWPNPSLAFYTVLHLGTLMAVLSVFWRDLLSLAGAWWKSVTKQQLDAAEARVAWWIAMGTIPAALMGILWEGQFEALFHSPLHAATLLLITGVWLALAERHGRREREPAELDGKESLLIGLAQGCAIAPGISRSGATIGAGMLLGLRREAATRYSFLLAAPIIFGAGLLQVKRLLELPDLGPSVAPLLLGFAAALASGYACIRFLLSYVKERSLVVFAAYCWVVGLGAIAIYLLR